MVEAGRIEPASARFPKSLQDLEIGLKPFQDNGLRSLRVCQDLLRFTRVLSLKYSRITPATSALLIGGPPTELLTASGCPTERDPGSSSGGGPAGSRWFARLACPRGGAQPRASRRATMSLMRRPCFLSSPWKFDRCMPVCLAALVAL